MRLEQFEFLLAVAEKKSMQKAANMLHTSVQNISKTIKQFENELNTSIFIRNKYGVFLTQDGEHIYTIAKEIMSNVDLLQNRYCRNITTSSIVDTPEHINILSAHASSAIFSALQEQVCKEFLPNSAALIIKDALDINNLIETDLDSLFIHNDLISSNLTQSELNRIRDVLKGHHIFFLRKDRLGVRVNDTNTLIENSKISIKDIIDQPLIMAQPDEKAFSHLQIAIESLGVILKPKYIVNTPASVNRYVQNNWGYAIVTYDEKEAKALPADTTGTTIIPLKEEIFVHHILIVNPNFIKTACYQRTMNLLKKYYKDMRCLY